jgi:twitching motility protein PilT
VTGATGSGKSTTLAAMVDKINRTRKQHIVTIEDPIEILHADHGCIVNQREVGLDTESFGQALRRVLRQDPDVILIGELRDEETAQVALQAAESGHLVLSTMHTVDAAETIGRMIEFFPAQKQMMIRQILSGVLRGVVSQRLLPALGGGRIVAIEVMMNTARIAELIREPEKTEGVLEAIEEGGFHHMQSFSQHLVQLVLEDQVDFDTAAAAATNRHDFELSVQQALKQRQAATKAAEAAEAVAETAAEEAASDLDDGSGSLRLAAS